MQIPENRAKAPKLQKQSCLGSEQQRTTRAEQKLLPPTCRVLITGSSPSFFSFPCYKMSPFPLCGLLKQRPEMEQTAGAGSGGHVRTSREGKPVQPDLHLPQQTPKRSAAPSSSSHTHSLLSQTTPPALPDTPPFGFPAELLRRTEVPRSPGALGPRPLNPTLPLFATLKRPSFQSGRLCKATFAPRTPMKY